MKLSREAIQRMVGDRVGGSGAGGAGISGNQVEQMLAGYARQEWVDSNYVSIEFFGRLFQAYNGNTAVNPNDTTTTIDNIKAMFGFWTEQYLSARGRGAGGGGGGGTGNVTWDELAGTAVSPHKVDISYLTGAISTLTGGTSELDNKRYAVQLNDNNQLFVDVPWTDTDHYDWDDITNKPATATRWPAFSEVTGSASASQVPNIENLTNFSSRVYDATVARTANTVLAGPTSGNAVAATFRALVAADIPSLAISKITGLQTALDSKLDIAFFSSLFKAYNGTTEVAPNGGDTSTIDNIKAMFGFWTKQYLSARGRGAGGGGGGGTGNVTWDELVGTAATGRKVDISYLADAISTLTGYTTSGRNYAVEVNASNQLYVNVPWTDHTYTLAGLVGSTAIGDGNTPVYWTGSAFTACDKPLSGAWFKGVVTIGNNGVMEVGRYIDFHPTDGSTLDFNVRLDAGTGTTERTFTFPSVAGTLLSSGNSSVSLSNDNQTLTVKINGTEKSLTNTNTWRPLGNGATDACAGNDSRLSDARPASDVYSWAKQSTKPSYNLDEVGDGSTRKLANYLPLTGGSLSGALALAAGQYNGYKTGDARSYGLNANNSDIIGINSLITADLSDGWDESIGFARTNGHYDTFRAADGVFYFGFNGYYDGDNVEHAASEIIQLKSTGSIECVRADTSDSRILVNNTNSSGYSVMLLASTNRGLYLENKGWIIVSDGTNCWSAFGNFGIGTNSPQYKLHVAGDIVATGCLTGRVTSASDIHAKNISSTVLPLSLVEIANAPTIRFKWKQGDDQADHVGSIAQYWQSVMPEVIWKNKEGMLTLEYGTAALISSITIAREVAALKQRIKELERKLKN